MKLSIMFILVGAELSLTACGTSDHHVDAANAAGPDGGADGGGEVPPIPRGLVVEGNGLLVATGDDVPSVVDGTDLGGVAPNGVVTRTFVLRNTEARAVTIAAPIVLDGNVTGELRVEQPPVTTLEPGASTTMKIALAASGLEGLRRATVRITWDGTKTYSFAVRGSVTYFPTFADELTVAQWSFDERQYGYTTLTDASRHEHDLLLMEDGALEPGRFGLALRAKPGAKFHVSYASWQGDLVNENMRGPDGTPSGMWGPTEDPRPLLEALAGPEWTFETWLKIVTKPAAEAFLVDLGDAFAPGFSVSASAGAAELVVSDAYAGQAWACPTASPLADGGWHHVAFTLHGGTLFHHVDGAAQPKPRATALPKQPLPPPSRATDLEHDTRGFTKDSPEAWRREHRFNVALAEDRHGERDLDAALDEVRFSSVARYDERSGPPPGSVARAWGPSAPKPAAKAGPPLLFPSGQRTLPIQIGPRKHVFIDDVLIDSRQNVGLRMHPLGNRVDVLVNTPAGPKPLDPPGSTWRETIYDHEGKVNLFIADGYSSSKGITRLYTSADGVTFDEAPVGIFEDGGSRANDFVFYHRPLGACVFEDASPSAGPEELFKVTAFAPNRGTVLYVSPDGLHYRRNESQMLPLMSGGDAETFYDDQRGMYVTHLKRDSGSGTSLLYRGRRAVLFETDQPFSPWPMKVLPSPYFEGYPIPTVTEEGPATFEPVVVRPFTDEYDVYRVRPHKYPWAPDTYVAFPWMGFHDYTSVIGGGEHKNEKRRRTRLATSRDGEHWTYFGGAEDWYMDDTGTIDGEDTREALSFLGMVRRGDEILQYAEYSTENNGDGKRRYSRLVQRLDGFVSLHADAAGTATTHPLVFQGNKLVLNAAAAGSLRVGLATATGQPIAGFSTDDCDAAPFDEIGHTVTWHGSSAIGAFANTPVRLVVAFDRADLYALQFVP